MNDPVPSKEQCQHQLPPDLCRLCMQTEITRLREDNRRWENAHKILLAEIERLKRPAHEREPPHCSTCACGLPASLDEQALLDIAKQFDQGPGATFEFEQPTLLAMLRSLAATVEGMVRVVPEPCARCVALEQELSHYRHLAQREIDAGRTVPEPAAESISLSVLADLILHCHDKASVVGVLREQLPSLRPAQPPGAGQ